MSDYKLDKLNTREFEHLTQALCKKFIAIGVTPFGDGPDGGREATFDGSMDYPSQGSKWDGYLVVQCKFRQRSSVDADSDADWAVKELRAELSKYNAEESASNKLRKVRKIPKYFLFVTNVVLTPALAGGGRDRCISALKEDAENLGIVDWDVWGFDDICRYLDNAEEIRKAYSGFILPGDVLVSALENLKIDNPDFNLVLSKFIQKEFKSDSAAKLQSAGQYDLKYEVPLSSVFHDIPFNFSKDASLEPNENHIEVINFLTSEGDRVIRYGSERDDANVPIMPHAKNGRYVLVGGPGQGKSTVGQYLCQLYRAVIIRDISNCPIDDGVAPILLGIESATSTTNISLPNCRRFPIRIVLNSFASDLASEASLTVIEYIKRKLIRLGGVEKISLETISKWLSGYPWLFVLDGLDEVPSSSNRSEVLTAIQDFLVDLTANKADVIVIATTRPQGYSDDLAKDFFNHMYLAPLNKKQALEYGSSLLKQRSGGDEEKFSQTQRRMNMAAQNEATVRLMRTPLQVTIMATLVERLGEPPKQRYRLFAEYYRTIYERESNREGVLSLLLNDRKTDIDIIHYRTGIFLQSDSEKAGGTDATMPLDSLLNLVKLRLIDENEGDPNEIEPLIVEIREAALERLVFLVSLKNESIGFEIRSLQEFMAAEAICRSASTDVLINRITEIAPISHWRNVILFLVGKCFFEDNSPVLDRILLLCDELNDDLSMPEYSIVKWGSQLALDILTDGAARNNPKRERKLVHTALGLLETPKTHYVAELASIYHPGLEKIFKEKIYFLITSSHVADAIPAWHLLQNLVSKNIDWAEILFNEVWERLNFDCRKTVLDPSQVANNNFLMKKIIEAAPKWRPWDVFSLLDKNRFQVFRNRGNEKVDFDAPNWFQAVRDISLNLGWVFFSNKIGRSGRRIIKWEKSEVSINVDFVSIKNDSDALVGLDLASIPYENLEWIPYIATAIFLANPSSDTLAEALSILASYDRPARMELMAPWPLAIICNLALSKEELLDFSKKAKDKVFGDYSDWVLVEENAVADESFVNKSLSENKSREELLFSVQHNFPLFCTGLEIRVDESCLILEQIKGEFKKASGIYQFWLAELYVDQLAIHGHKFIPGDKVKISSDDFCKILHMADRGNKKLRPTIFEMVELVGDEIDEYIKVFDYLNEFGDELSFIYNIRSEEDSWLDIGYKLVLETLGPTSQVLDWGLMLARLGKLPKVPLKMRTSSSAAKKLSAYEQSLLGLGSSDFNEKDIDQIIFQIYEDLFNEKPSFDGEQAIVQLVNAILRLSVDEGRKMLVHCIGKMRENKEMASKLPVLILCDEIERLLRTKKAGFSVSSTRWNELAFPRLH